MINRVVRTSITKQNPFTPNSVSPQIQQEYVHEAVVVDVIVNEKHPEYAKDGYNIGAVKFRVLKSDMYKDNGDLNWALPIESNITEYPLLNEVVLIIPSLNRFYYGRKVNTTSRVTAQPMYGVNDDMALPPSDGEKVAGYRRSVATPVQSEKKKNTLGNYFKDLPTVYRLKHDEGDKIIEGRSGHSIRFGAAWQTENTFFKSTEKDQAPNILMRVGPNPNAKPTVNTTFGLVLEDINKDLSSIWMVSNQLVDLEYATKDSPVHRKSVEAFPTRLTGNQIVINTDRFVVNTKTDRIMGFAKLGINWTTSRDFTVDAERDYRSQINRNKIYRIGGFFESTAERHHAFISPLVYLGMNGDRSQPVPQGANLAQFLLDFIDAHLMSSATHVMTTMGPGALHPAIIAKLTRLRADVQLGVRASFNSRNVYTR